MAWVLDHLADLESDFSAIHRVDDMYALDTATFFSRVYRMSAYQGVIRMRVEAEQERQERRAQRRPATAARPPAAPVAGPGSAPTPEGARMVPLAALMFESGQGEHKTVDGG